MGKTALVILGLLGALVAGGCGDTLQNQPAGPGPFESVIVKSRFPVYWAGLRFEGMQVSSVTIDPGGAVTIKYGDCLVGGQYTCVTPLSIVTSPDNSFVPLGETRRAAFALRGVSAAAAEGGRTLAIATGPVVATVYARTRGLAYAAAQTMTPLNETGAPEAALPRPLPDTGFDRRPLRSQLPPGAIAG